MNEKKVVSTKHCVANNTYIGLDAEYCANGFINILKVELFYKFGMCPKKVTESVIFRSDQPIRTVYKLENIPLFFNDSMLRCFGPYISKDLRRLIETTINER